MRQRTFRWLFTIVTLLYVFVTPPFQAHDERNHYFKSMLLSEGTIFNGTEDGELGAPLPGYASDLADRRFPIEIAHVHHTYRWADLVAAWSLSGTGEERRFAAFSNIANYAPSLYAPQALGMVAARALGLPPLGQFYAGRLLNAALGIALVLLAIALMPVGREAMTAFAALPMVAHQLGSLSADSSIIGLSFLGLAVSLNLASRVAPPRWALLGPVLLSLLALAKGVYLPLTLAGLALRGRRRWFLAWLGVSLLVAVAVAVSWLRLNSGNFYRQAFVSRRTLENARAALPAEQLAHVMSHPLDFALTLVSSFVERLPVYAIDAIGRFGWFTILLPIPLYALAVAVVGAALIRPDAARPSPGQRAFWAALVLGGCALIETALYLTATELGARHVEGVQGRYFIPYLPLLGLILLWPMPAGGRVRHWLHVAWGPALGALMAGGVIVQAIAFWRW